MPRGMKGAWGGDVRWRLRIRCRGAFAHSKLLSFKRNVPRETVELAAELLCGTSELYFMRPKEKSPVGICAQCKMPLDYEIEEVSHAEPTQPDGDQSRPLRAEAAAAADRRTAGASDAHAAATAPATVADDA